MRPKKSVNELEEKLRESRPAETAVPAHFRQQLRHDLQRQATANTSPSLSSRWLLAPVALVMVVIVVFWVGWPRTAVDTANEVNITRPVPTPDTSAFAFNRDEAMQAAYIFARRPDNKPIGGWLAEPNIRAITVTMFLEAYDVAVNRLGSFAIADFGGSNILFPENESETVWFVQLVGRWQPFGETADHIEPMRYVGVLVNLNTGQIVAAGSSTVSFVSEPIVLSLADYPPQERPYLVEQGGGFWLVHAGSELLAFDRRAPYRPDLPPSEERPSRCLYAWVEANGRFTDPCSGDEWDLDGRLYLAESTELWSDRNLDQYRVELADGDIIVHLDEIIFGEVVAPVSTLGTLEQPQTDFDIIVDRIDTLASRQQVFLTRQSGWFHMSFEEYRPLEYRDDSEMMRTLFPTEQMVYESWYDVAEDGRYVPLVVRYLDADGNQTQASIFASGNYVNLTFNEITPAAEFVAVPNETRQLVRELREMRNHAANPPSASAYTVEEDGRFRYYVRVTTIYDQPIHTGTNSSNQTITGEEIRYTIDLDSGRLLSKEVVGITAEGETIVNSHINYLAAEWVTDLPAEATVLLAQGEAALNDPGYVYREGVWGTPPPPPTPAPNERQTNFHSIIDQLDALARRRQGFLTSQSGWFYSAVQEYWPLDYKGETGSFFATFSTEQMLNETWYHALGDGSADQVIYRYTNADGLVVALTIFIDGYNVNFFGDTMDQAPQQSLTIPNEAAWVAELLGEMQDYQVNEPSVSAYVEQVDGRSHYTIHITNGYYVPIPAEMNTLGQTMLGDETNYTFDFDTAQLLSQENIALVDSAERLVSFSRNLQVESWLSALPDDIAFNLAQAQTRLNSSNLTWIAPTATPDFNLALAQVSDTQYGITVSVLEVSEEQDEVAVRMVAQVDPSWGVVHAFPFFQTFISNALLYGERPFTPTHASGESVEVDKVTGGWQEGSTHYFEGALVAGEELRLETAVDLSGISRVITLPITLEEAAVGQSWSLDWPVSIGAAQLRVAEVEWMAETADGQAQLQLHVLEGNPAEIDIYCLSIGTADPWQEDCPLFEEDANYTITAPLDEPIVLHLRVSLLINGFELRWQP